MNKKKIIARIIIVLAVIAIAISIYSEDNFWEETKKSAIETYNALAPKG